MASKKILVVSRDANVVSLLKLGLGRDFEVSAVGINEQGILAVISQRKPDLIILEIVMPRGQEIILGLRIRQLSEVPLIMLSVSGAEGVKVRKLNLEARDFLGENLTAPALKEQIQEALSAQAQEKGP